MYYTCGRHERKHFLYLVDPQSTQSSDQFRPGKTEMELFRYFDCYDSGYQTEKLTIKWHKFTKILSFSFERLIAINLK